VAARLAATVVVRRAEAEAAACFVKWRCGRANEMKDVRGREKKEMPGF
jgi:hypothetical protein